MNAFPTSYCSEYSIYMDRNTHSTENSQNVRPQSWVVRENSNPSKILQEQGLTGELFYQPENLIL